MSAVTAKQAFEVAGIQPATLRKWVERGKVRRYGRGAYDIDDIAREAQRIAASEPPLDEDP